jgi:HEAT repeat protein
MAVIRLLKDKEIEVRIGAALVLGRLGDRRAALPLKHLLDDPFSEVREAAEAALLRIEK